MILNDVFDRKRIFANRHEQENSKGGSRRNVSGSCKQSDPERQKRFKGKDNFAQRSPCGLHMPKSAKKGAVETTAPYNIGSVT